MPPEKPRVIMEKSSTVRRRYQRSNKRFTFTAEQIKRIEREKLCEQRAKDLREKEKRRIANKKKKTEKEAKAREEARLQGLPDPFGFKIPASQPLLANFFGRKNKSAISEEPETTKPEELVSKQSSRETSPSEDQPLKQQESVMTEISGSQQSSHQNSHNGQLHPEKQANSQTEELDSKESLSKIPLEEPPIETEKSVPQEAFGENLPSQQLPLWQQEKTKTPLSTQSYPEHPPSESPFIEQPSLEHALPEQPHTEISTHYTTTDTNNNTNRFTEDEGTAGDTELESDIFDDLDEELEHEMAILQEAVLPVEAEIHAARIDTSVQSVFPTDEFSDCSAFDDDEILKQADAATRLVNPSIPVSSVLMQPSPTNSLKRKIPLEESFRDDTADYLEEVFARGSGASFGELVQY